MLFSYLPFWLRRAISAFAFASVAVIPLAFLLVACGQSQEQADQEAMDRNIEKVRLESLGMQKVDGAVAPSDGDRAMVRYRHSDNIHCGTSVPDYEFVVPKDWLMDVPDCQFTTFQARDGWTKVEVNVIQNPDAYADAATVYAETLAEVKASIGVPRTIESPGVGVFEITTTTASDAMWNGRPAVRYEMTLTPSDELLAQGHCGPQHIRQYVTLSPSWGTPPSTLTKRLVMFTAKMCMDTNSEYAPDLDGIEASFRVMDWASETENRRGGETRVTRRLESFSR